MIHGEPPEAVTGPYCRQFARVKLARTRDRLRPLMSRKSDIVRAIDEILRPLLEADGAGVTVVEVAEDGSRVALTLTGALRGDPGVGIVKERVIEPLVRRAAAGDVAISYVL